MKLKQKLGVAGIFALGIFVIISSSTGPISTCITHRSADLTYQSFEHITPT